MSRGIAASERKMRDDRLVRKAFLGEMGEAGGAGWVEVVDFMNFCREAAYLNKRVELDSLRRRSLAAFGEGKCL